MFLWKFMLVCGIVSFISQGIHGRSLRQLGENCRITTGPYGNSQKLKPSCANGKIIYNYPWLQWLGGLGYPLEIHLSRPFDFNLCLKPNVAVLFNCNGNTKTKVNGGREECVTCSKGENTVELWQPRDWSPVYQMIVNFRIIEQTVLTENKDKKSHLN